MEAREREEGRDSSFAISIFGNGFDVQKRCTPTNPENFSYARNVYLYDQFDSI